MAKNSSLKDSNNLNGLLEGLKELENRDESISESEDSVSECFSSDDLKKAAKKKFNNESSTSKEAASSGSEERKTELENNGKLDTGLTDAILNEEKLKLKYVPKIIIGTAIYFCVVTLAVFIYLFIPGTYPFKLKSILIGGFFANLVGLLIIIFKYIFSPSKDMYNLLMNFKEYLQKSKSNK